MSRDEKAADADAHNLCRTQNKMIELVFGEREKSTTPTTSSLDSLRGFFLVFHIFKRIWPLILNRPQDVHKYVGLTAKPTRKEGEKAQNCGIIIVTLDWIRYLMERSLSSLSNSVEQRNL